MTYILGISAYYHDSAAVLLFDSEIVAAVQEERFTRIRHDASFPEKSIKYCLETAGVSMQKIDHIIFYDKPFLKFERLLETHIASSPFGLPAFIKAMPVWLKEKLYLKKLLRDALVQVGGCSIKDLPALLFSSHHQAHAASAYYASPFDEAAVLCLDGVGEWQTSTGWLAKNNQMDLQWHLDFPHSLGLLYSAFTYYTGFRVNSGEYKLMGLAPYGKPLYVDLILEHLIDLKADGSFRLNMHYFNFAAGLTMTNRHFHDLFGGQPRSAESEISQKIMDIARSIQYVTEEIVIRLATTLQQETGLENLCLAGGVALNCVANGRLRQKKIFKNIWIQPAAGDAGGALGAAYLVWYQYLDNKRKSEKCLPDPVSGYMQTPFLGTEYNDAEIEHYLLSVDACYQKFDDESLSQTVAGNLAENKVVGWFQGRMEYGPRALGNRSILADPRSETMQATLNIKIKKRESFRPFAPAILKEKQGDWFEMQEESPFMLFVSPLKKNKCIALHETTEASGIELLQQKRSALPAITHVDYSARLQTVSEHCNKTFYRLLKRFDAITDCPVLINTSFNVRGEPIVESPQDALRCFMNTDMDVLAIGDFVLNKQEQPADLAERLNAQQKSSAAATKLDNERATVPGKKELRQFAISTGVVIFILFGWLFPWLMAREMNLTVLIFVAAWIVWSALLPYSIKAIYHGWMRFGLLMSKVITPLILSAIYFLLITPLGFFMRVFAKDPLNRKILAAADSYRHFTVKPAEHRVTEKSSLKQAAIKENLEKPF